jgi:hypothetical protein
VALCPWKMSKNNGSKKKANSVDRALSGQGKAVRTIFRYKKLISTFGARILAPEGIYE